MFDLICALPYHQNWRCTRHLRLRRLLPAELNGNNIADLLISNPLGQVQVLTGNGDGTFQPAENLDQQVGPGGVCSGRKHAGRVHLTDQLTDQLIVTTTGGVTSVLGDASTGLVTPGAVALADLNNNGILDLIVANSGSNNVLIYPGLGNGAFGPALNDGNGFFTGTDPWASPLPTLPATAGST